MPRHAPLLGLFLALLGLSGLTPSASAQGLLPQFSIEASGACRQLSVRDRDGKTQAPLGCLSSGKWTLQPERLQILGSGSIGDGSAFSVTPKDSATPRALSALLSGLPINALDYVSLAAVNAQADVSGGFNAAAAAARAAKRPLTVPGIPGKPYVIKQTVDITDVDLACNGANFYTGDNVHMFFAQSKARIHGCSISHDGLQGRILSFNGSGGNSAHDNTFTAGNPANTDALVWFNGSDNNVYDNKFLSRRTNGYAWKNERNDPSIISINNSIRANYFVGSGTGGWVGDNGQAPRPEGIIVSDNNSVLTGGPFLTMRSVLSARIHGNMMDQAPASTGAVLFTPGGFGNYGLDGVVFTNNYMSAVGNGGAGPAFISLAGPARGVKFIGNHMAFGTKAALLFPGIEAVFTGNDMAGGSTDHCVELSDPILLSTVVFTDNKQCTKSPIRITNYPQAGAPRATNTVAYNTASGSQYIEVLHGLAAKPTKFKIGVSIVGPGGAPGGAVVASASAMAAAVTDSVVTLAVSYTGKASDGLIWITVESEI